MGIPGKPAWTGDEPTESTQPKWDMPDDRRMAWIKWVPEALKTFVGPSGEVKHRIQLDLDDTENLGQALGIIVGAASVSWRDDDVDGRVFDTEMALDIVTQAEHEITRRVREMFNALVEASDLGVDLSKFVANGPDPEPERPDTLAQWLYNRFSDGMAPGWEHANQSYWEHQAAAVRRAVARGGFKNPMPYNPNKAQCWCGSRLTKREPGDAWGYGCKRNITHKWDGGSDIPAGEALCAVRDLSGDMTPCSFPPHSPMTVHSWQSPLRPDDL